MKDSPPDFAFLYQTVTHAESQLQAKRDSSKFAKLKEKFGKVCKSLDNHKGLLAFVPSNDKYTSLITGTISTLVTVSCHHPFARESIILLSLTF
jgi:hypothetical protein